MRADIDSPDTLREHLSEAHYVASQPLAVVSYLALALNKPLLVEGPAGVGKTALAQALAEVLGLPLIRLQCYEGLDESRALYEWAYAKQLLYIQLLRDRVDHLLTETVSLQDAVVRLGDSEDAFFSERFLLPRPLLRALQAPEGCVLLIDEVDKSDPEFEAFLLEFLADFAITIPELDTVQARVPPVVVLTSNDQRDLSEPLKRRCLHLFIDHPAVEVERKILQLKVPGVDTSLLDQALRFIHHIRALDLRKPPSISEGIDWLRSLLALGVREWDHAVVRQTLSVLLKYRDDTQRVEADLDRYH